MRAAAIFFTPDPGSDGHMDVVEWLRFVIGRLVLVASIGFCVFTVAFDIMGPLFYGLAGGGPIGLIVGLIGAVFGVVIGFSAPFMEAFGLHLASLERKFSSKVGLWLLTAICVVITIGAQALLGSHLIAADRERLEMAEGSDTLALEQAGAMRDTSGAEQRMTDAREDLTIARAAREEANSLRAELAVLPTGEYDPRIREIQTIIGTVPDGIKYDATVEAMRVFADDAETEFRAAQERRDAAQAAMDEITARLGSGAVAQVELGATKAAETRSLTKAFRQISYQSYKVRGDERQFDAEAIDKRAKNFADSFAYIIVFFLNILNFGLNNTGHGRGARSDPPPARRLAAEPIGPIGPTSGFALPGAIRTEDPHRDVHSRHEALRAREAEINASAQALTQSAEAVQAKRDLDAYERELDQRAAMVARMRQYLDAGVSAEVAAERAKYDVEHGVRGPVRVQNDVRRAAAAADHQVRNRALGGDAFVRGSTPNSLVRVRDDGGDTEDKYASAMAHLERLNALTDREH